MSGHKWTDLTNSYSQTVDRIKAKDINKSARISTIIFSSGAKIFCEDEAPENINKKLPYSGGGTNFNRAFEATIELAQKYISKSIILFIFMTDGQSSYPDAEIAKLSKLQKDNPNMLKFSGIEFGKQCPLMTKIADELKGKTGVAYNAE